MNVQKRLKHTDGAGATESAKSMVQTTLSEKKIKISKIEKIKKSSFLSYTCVRARESEKFLYSPDV